MLNRLLPRAVNDQLCLCSLDSPPAVLTRTPFSLLRSLPSLVMHQSKLQSTARNTFGDSPSDQVNSWVGGSSKSLKSLYKATSMVKTIFFKAPKQELSDTMVILKISSPLCQDLLTSVFTNMYLIWIHKYSDTCLYTYLVDFKWTFFDFCLWELLHPVCYKISCINQEDLSLAVYTLLTQNVLHLTCWHVLKHLINNGPQFKFHCLNI